MSNNIAEAIVSKNEVISAQGASLDAVLTALEGKAAGSGSSGEVWEELTHFVYTPDSAVTSIKQTFEAGTYKKIYIVGHIVLSKTSMPLIKIDSDNIDPPKAFTASATSGTVRALVKPFGTGVGVFRTCRQPDNQYAWNGNLAGKTKNNIQMGDVALIELSSGHIQTTFAEGTDITIYGVKA